MKKVYCITIICLIISCLSAFLPVKANSSVGEGGAIICHCTRDISFHVKGCYVNTGGAVCAQSQNGANILCSNFDTNCA